MACFYAGEIFSLRKEINRLKIVVIAHLSILLWLVCNSFVSVVWFVLGKDTESIDCLQTAVSHFFLYFYFQLANSSIDDIVRLTNNDGVIEMISQCGLQMVLTVWHNILVVLVEKGTRSFSFRCNYFLLCI